MRQLVQIKRTRHSEKPDAVRERIEKMFPHQCKIELFARKRHQGWDAWDSKFTNFVKSAVSLAH